MLQVVLEVAPINAFVELSIPDLSESIQSICLEGACMQPRRLLDVLRSFPMEHSILPLSIFGVAIFEHHDTVAMMFFPLEFTFVVAVLVFLEGR